MLTDSFKTMIEKHCQFAENCMEGISHPDKKNAIKYLALLNCLLDHYLTKPNVNDEPRYTLIYLPKCPEWAEDVFFEFLVIKLALSNASISSRIKNDGDNIAFNNLTKKAIAKEKERRLYLKKLSNVATINKEYLENFHGCIGKSLIYYQKNRLENYQRKQKFSNDLIGEFPTKNIAVTSTAIKKVKDQIKNKLKLGFNCSLDNIVIFNSQNKDSKSFTKSEIEKLKQLGTGVKNVLVFDFSPKPFVLNNLFVKRNDLANRYAQQKGNDAEYVSFSKEELSYIFDSQCNSEIFEYGNEDNFLIFDANVKDVVDSMEYPIKNRNKLSICFDDKLTYSLLENRQDYLDIEDFEIYAKGLKKDWLALLTKIKMFKEEDDIAIIFPDTEEAIAKELQAFIAQQINCNVEMYSLHELKNGNVNQKKIVLFQYRSHNANTFFAKWPNSFDEFKLNAEQRILVLIQLSVFTDKFEWDMYDYNKLSNHILSSDFRNEFFPDSQLKLVKPSFSKVNLQDDNDLDDVNVQNYCYQITAEDRWSKKMYGTDYLLLCDTHEDSCSMSIKQVRAIYEEGEDKFIWYQGRPIDELVKYLSDIANKKANKETEQENEYKEKYQNEYGLDGDENIELWRRILKKKMESDKNVYSSLKQIVLGLNSQDKFISEKRFMDWINPKVTLTLPRQKRHQKAIWNFLSMSNAYLNFVRHRMHRQKNDAKERNRILTEFIVRYYYSFQEDDYEDYQSNDEFTAYLPLNREEFTELISALHDEISKEDIWAHLEIKKC